jgi:hypothetical protein
VGAFLLVTLSIFDNWESHRTGRRVRPVWSCAFTHEICERIFVFVSFEMHLTRWLLSLGASTRLVCAAVAARVVMYFFFFKTGGVCLWLMWQRRSN